MIKKLSYSNGDVEIKSAAHAMRESKKLKSSWSYETRLSQRILIYIAEILERERPKKRKIVISRWMRFSGQAIAQGKTMKEAASEWEKLQREKTK